MTNDEKLSHKIESRRRAESENSTPSNDIAANYKLLVDDMERKFVKDGQYNDYNKNIINQMRNTDVNSFIEERAKVIPANAEKQMDKSLYDLLSLNGCESYNPNEMYGVLAPIAFDITPSDKNADIARKGIYRMFTAGDVTNAMVQDMTERFIDDKGETTKNSKLYYEFLTRYPLSKEAFARIYNDTEIPAQWKKNISINPNNSTKEKTTFIDSVIESCFAARKFGDADWRMVNKIINMDSISEKSQKKIIDEYNSKRPIRGTELLYNAVLYSGKIKPKTFDYAIKNSQSAEESLRLYICKEVHNKKYNANQLGILMTIMNGYTQNFHELDKKINKGEFSFEKQSKEIIVSLKQQEDVLKDSEVLNLLAQKEEQMVKVERESTKLYRIVANDLINSTLSQVVRGRAVASLYIEEAINKADAYAQAKRVLEAELDKDAILDDIEEEREEENKHPEEER